MTEKHDEGQWKEEVAASEDERETGSGVGVDEREEQSAEEQAASESSEELAAASAEGVPESPEEEPSPQTVSEGSQEPESAGDAPSEEGGALDGAESVEGQEAESYSSNMDQYDETFVTLEPGQIVNAKVVQVGADEVMVDVGYKSEGRIPLHELGLQTGQAPSDVLEAGDEIEVFVLKVDDAEGNVLLSKRRADNRVAWEALERSKEADEVIEAPVTERVKGGLLVDVGVRGFVPASHVARNYVENLDKYVGETLRLKIIELDRQRNNVVLSHKEVLEQEYEEAKAKAFESLSEGSIVEGTVRRITDFGAFVDVGGGVEGLLHVSEMAWSRVRHPSDVVAEGDQINVMVLKVDADSERISLSLKETLPDPWLTVEERYQIDDIVEGTVTRVVDFGAFVKLEDGIEGLVHISQLADHHVANPSEVVNPGDTVKVKVVSLDPVKRRIGLSIRQAEPKREQPRERQRPKSAPGPRPGAQSGESTTVTLGEMFEDLGTLFSNDYDDEEEEDDEEEA